ncbi:MAG: hypothetical protein JXA44_04955 [Methanospirillaceae archaeon]|nr:hypothetical protein [Methanospirillaceae archaeon]
MRSYASPEYVIILPDTGYLVNSDLILSGTGIFSHHGSFRAVTGLDGEYLMS